MTAFDTDDPRNIWVSPNADADGDGLGTFDAPFASISDALSKVTPGQAIVLMPGTYCGDLTIEVSGEERDPIYITAYKQGEAVIDGGCWYFYDTSDMVVSGMTFRNSPRGAVSAVGQCLRNRFHSIKFIDCGTDGKESCTLYFGGAGGRFNLIEDCEFSRGGGQPSQNAAVGLMISDGGDGHHLTNHIIRHNRFAGYDRAVIIGSGGVLEFESGHIVERNIIEDSGADGITVKCGDVQIRKNFITKCAASGIRIDGGRYSVVEYNNISYCDSGISISGSCHTVTGNAIAACKTAVNPIGDHDGLIDDKNTIMEKLPEGGIIDNAADDEGAADADGYALAAMPDDGIDETDSDDDAAVNSEMSEMLRYMFNRDG